MANSVRDLALVFEAVAGDDPRDSSSSSRPVPDCIRRVDRAILPPESEEDYNKLYRPGTSVPTRFYESAVSPEISRFLESLIDDFAAHARLYAGVQRITLPPGFADVHRQHRLVMAVEAAKVHGTRLDRHPEDYPPHVRELIEAGRRVSAVEYREARLFRDELDDQCENLFWPEPLLMPATTSLPPTPETTGDPWCNAPWSFLGTPTLSVPLGRSADGLPMAAQFVGARWGEDSLLASAARIERVLHHPRRLPAGARHLIRSARSVSS